jgi:hypothetical protein
MGEAWEPSKMQGSCEKRGALDRKILPHFSVFIWCNNNDVPSTSFGMAKGRIDASQHFVLPDWHYVVRRNACRIWCAHQKGTDDVEH